jgi:hypothetical protein
MSDETRNFLNTGIFVVNIIFALVCGYGYYRNGNSDACWWSVIAAFWIIGSFWLECVNRQYAEVTQNLIEAFTKHIDELEKQIELLKK